MKESLDDDAKNGGYLDNDTMILLDESDLTAAVF